MGALCQETGHSPRIAYAAQTAIPEELEHTNPVLMPILKDRDIYDSNLWLGPSGTISPLHRDPNSNLFAQIVGKKRWMLYEPKICAYPFEGRQSNSSRVDPEAEACVLA